MKRLLFRSHFSYALLVAITGSGNGDDDNLGDDVIDDEDGSEPLRPKRYEYEKDDNHMR